MKKLIAATTALALLATPVPASAHGNFWGGFAAGAITSMFAAPFFGPPVVYAPPPIGYAYPFNPPVYYYPPGAPTVVVPQVTPDPAIRFVQHALNFLGYGPLNEDGIEGPETYNAICAFQLRNHLVVDGIAGSAFFAVINAQLPPPPPPPVAHPAPAPEPHDDKSPAPAPTMQRQI